MDLRQLRYFVAVAEELHFGRAAQRLGMSQPPLSEQIRLLEARLGVLLFIRNRRKVELTPAGRMLLDEARKLLDHAERVSDAMRSARAGQLGELRLGSVPSALFEVLPRVLASRVAAGSRLRLSVREAHTTEILEAVRDRRFDAGLIWSDRAEPPVLLRPLERVDFIVALPDGHPLAHRSSVAITDLEHEPLIVPPRVVTPDQFDRIVAGFRQHRITPVIASEVRSVASQLGYVVSGLGIALVPRYARKLAPAGVVFRALSEPIESTPISLAWHGADRSPQIEELLRIVTMAFGAQPV